MRLATVSGLALAALLGGLAPAVRAEDAAPASESGFTFGGSLDVELNLDVYGRRGDRRGYADLYTNSELALYLNMPFGFTLNGVFKIEQSDRDRGDGDRGFAKQTGWVDELNLSWSQGPLEVFGGKFHPRFGFAWDRAPGLYGTDLAETYELAEKLGGGVQLSWSELAGLSERIGEHDIRFEVFAADRSLLSSAAFSPRYAETNPSTGDIRWLWRNRRSTGGADNTEGAENWVISAAGSGIPMPVGTLDYTLGYSSRRAGLDSVEAGTAATERGYVAGIAWEIPLPLRITATPMAEWVRLENADGVRDLRRDVLTAGVELARAPFSVAYAYAWQSDSDVARYRAAQHSASVTYDLGDAASWLSGFAWTVGWRRLREDGVSADDFGTQIVYGLRF